MSGRGWYHMRNETSMNAILSLFPTTVTPETASLTVFLVLFVGVGIGIGFLLGRNRLVNVVMNVYVAMAFSAAAQGVVPKSFPLDEAALFLVLLVLLTLIDRSLFEIHVPSVPQDVLWRVVVTGVVVAGMVTSVLIRLLPGKTVALSPIPIPIRYFGTPLAELLWLAAPLLILLLMNRRSK